MDRKEIEQEIIRIVGEQKRLDGPIDPAAPLSEAGIDSLDGLNILFALEEHFQVSIPDDRARSIKTLGDMVSTIEDLVAAHPS